MKFHLLFASSVSACFELDTDTSYYADEKYKVAVNAKSLEEEFNTNVFSLYDLQPDTEYTVTVGDYQQKFSTKSESMCLNVSDFGAKGDGVSCNTTALQTAINACPKNGRVIVPMGTYITGPLLLGSDMTLELKKGAVLLGSINEDDYPVWPGEIPCGNDSITQISSWEGNPYPCRQSFLSIYNKENVYVVGQGTIDGNAQNSTWWDNPKDRKDGRPRMMFANNCNNLFFHGITVMNSPSWNLHPFFSKNISFYNMHVIAPKDSPNTDGCNPESCENVDIIGMRFSVGDDAIAIKSGKLYMGEKYKTPARNHTIRNCIMEFAHGGVVLGSEMSGGVKDLTVTQCLFKGTDRGLRIKTRRGRGKDGVIDGISFENIKMENVLTPLVVNMYYFCDPDGKSDYVQSREKQPLDDSTPYIGKFLFKDIECTDCEYAAGYFHGLPEQPIGGITLENVSFHMKADASKGRPAMMCNIDDFSKAGLYFNCVKNVSLKNVTFAGVEGDEVTAIEVENYKKED